MAKRTRVDSYWQQIKPTLYNDEIKMRPPAEQPEVNSLPMSPKNKDKLQTVTSKNPNGPPLKVKQIVEEMSSNDHPISS